MDSKQYIGLKIQAILAAKGLKQKSLAKAIGVGERHVSKKIGKEATFSHAQVAAAADFLGVTVEYLLDGSRLFNLGDTIDMLPPDAIAPPPPTPITDASDPVAALVKLAEMNMAKYSAMQGAQTPAINAEANQELLSELLALTSEVRLLREEIRLMRERSGGEHDPD